MQRIHSRGWMSSCAPPILGQSMAMPTLPQMQLHCHLRWTTSSSSMACSHAQPRCIPYSCLQCCAGSCQDSDVSCVLSPAPQCSAACLRACCSAALLTCIRMTNDLNLIICGRPAPCKAVMCAPLQSSSPCGPGLRKGFLSLMHVAERSCVPRWIR